MLYKRLFIWVEGEDDKIFFQNIIQDELSSRYDHITVNSYRGDNIKNPKEKKKLIGFINSIDSINRKGTQLIDYIFVADFDNSKCITQKKQKIKELLINIPDEKILIVIKEIESWYLAGIDMANRKRLKIRKYNERKTNDVTKDFFYSLLPNQTLKVPLLLDITSSYSIELAKKNNTSFKYFLSSLKKYCY